jgi:hypothetical protein
MTGTLFRPLVTGGWANLGGAFATALRPPDNTTPRIQVAVPTDHAEALAILAQPNTDPVKVTALAIVAVLLEGEWTGGRNRRKY